MTNLHDIQKELKEWGKKNFPKSNAEDMLIGVMEELGELAHANLKRRKLGRDTFRKEKDAIGDIVIFLLQYCNKRGILLDVIVQSVWNKVKKRNYITKRKHNLKKQ